MRSALLAFAVLLLLSVSAASASIVIHDGQPGIVATGTSSGELNANSYSLDSLGRVWLNCCQTGWTRDTQGFDPPMPIEDIKFWEVANIITIDNHLWSWVGGSVVWLDKGEWPGLSAAPEASAESMAASPKTTPNPSAGSCRVTFQTAAAGPVAVRVFDASGRMVRQLHDGTLPAGDFSLPWDGRDADAHELPSGVYFAKVTTPAGETSGRVVLTR